MADAEVILRKLLNKTLDDLDYTPRQISLEATTSGGANYTSGLFVIDVSSPNKDDLHLFAKVAIVGEKLREQMLADALYSTEDYVYKKLAACYNQLQNKHDVPAEYRFVFPKLFACNTTVGEETFIFENLVSQGFDMYSRFESIDWQHAAAAMTNLARFHALSFAFQKDNPEEFAKVSGPRKFPESKGEAKEAFVKSIMQKLEEIEDEGLRRKVGRFLQEEVSPESPGGRRGDYAYYYRPRGTNVIVHGDYRVSNVMYKKQGDQLSSVMIDFQLVHGGCPISDILYFVGLGSDEEFRRNYFDQLLDHYYSELTLALKRLHLEVTEVYPREQFDKELQQSLSFILLLSLVILPVVVVEAGGAPQVSGRDAELSQFIITPTKLYAQRLNGIVRDCERWGVI